MLAQFETLFTKHLLDNSRQQNAVSPYYLRFEAWRKWKPMIGEGASLERRVNTVKNGGFFWGGGIFITWVCLLGGGGQ